MQKNTKISLIILIVFFIINSVFLFFYFFNQGSFKRQTEVSIDLAQDSELNLETGDDDININQKINHNTNQSNTNTSDSGILYNVAGLKLSIKLYLPFYLSGVYTMQDEFFQAQTSASNTNVKLEILRADNPKKIDLLEWVASQGYYQDEELTMKNLTIDNYPALSREVLMDFTAYRDIYIAVNKKVYIINIVGERNQYDVNKEVIEKIIKSLNFNKNENNQ